MNTKKVVKIVIAIVLWAVILFAISDALLGRWITHTKTDVILFAVIDVIFLAVGGCFITDCIKNDWIKNFIIDSLEKDKKDLEKEIKSVEDEIDSRGRTKKLDERLAGLKEELTLIKMKISEKTSPLPEKVDQKLFN